MSLNQNNLLHKNPMISPQYTSEEKAWDKLMIKSGTAHYMQSSAWGRTKAHSFWPSAHLVVNSGQTDIPLQVFSRTVPSMGKLYYAPEVDGISAEHIPALTSHIKNQYGKGLAFKLELYQPYSEPLVNAFLKNGWVVAHSVQPRNTVIVDLSGTPDELFARLKPRARYEARTAQRGGVTIEKAEVTKERLVQLAQLMNETAKRTGAFFRNDAYSNRYWNAFASIDQGSLYFAWRDADLLAGAYVINYGKNAWYKDGGSVRLKSDLMAARLLHCEIMNGLQAKGIKNYDLCGIPAQEDLATSPMKGLYTFKTGFAKETTKFMPALELPLSKRYPLWPKTERHFLRLYSGFKKDFWY